ncbi:BQ2448_2402 [Microbotryum intermedium]|uniref:BQ2448_2402 protein n=1 Tax=Microbotryum intermedium TaxID=269621 RepID=A0A238F641_9BASI|nr:BQ2448_2402 [Microbotryum intermedium]
MWPRHTGPRIKEHVCITVMASTGSHSALVISTFAAEKLYYNIDLNYGVVISTLIASQFFGYGLGGLFRSIPVYPTFAVWPILSPSVSLMETLYREPDLEAQKRQYKFFWIGFAAIFVCEWFLEIIAPTLTRISVFYLANRTNPNFTRVFGGSNGNEGLGLFSIGLDWLQITSCKISDRSNALKSCNSTVATLVISTAPLYLPWATTVSKGLGVLVCIIVSIAGYFGNAWNAKNYPFLGESLFYEVGKALTPFEHPASEPVSDTMRIHACVYNGTRYQQNLILDTNHNLNKTALAEQGGFSFGIDRRAPPCRVLLSRSSLGLVYYELQASLHTTVRTQVVRCFGVNLSIGASVMHVFLWYRKHLVAAWKKWRGDVHDDPHYLKMQA